MALPWQGRCPGAARTGDLAEVAEFDIVVACGRREAISTRGDSLRSPDPAAVFVCSSQT